MGHRLRRDSYTKTKETHYSSYIKNIKEFYGFIDGGGRVGRVEYLFDANWSICLIVTILPRIFRVCVLLDTISFEGSDKTKHFSPASWWIMNIKSIFEESKRPISASADGKKCARRPYHQGQTVDGKIIGFAEMVGKKRTGAGRGNGRLVVGNARWS